MSAEEYLMKYQKEKGISRIYLDENLKPDILRIMESYAREYHQKEMQNRLEDILEEYQHYIDWNEDHDRNASSSERIKAFLNHLKQSNKE